MCSSDWASAMFPYVHVRSGAAFQTHYRFLPGASAMFPYVRVRSCVRARTFGGRLPDALPLSPWGFGDGSVCARTFLRTCAYVRGPAFQTRYRCLSGASAVFSYVHVRSCVREHMFGGSCRQGGSGARLGDGREKGSRMDFLLVSLIPFGFLIFLQGFMHCAALHAVERLCTKVAIFDY